VSGASVRPPSSGWFFGPSSVRFFFFLALSGFARFGPGVLVLVFSLFPFPFCVPPLVFRLSNCHLIFIVISFSSFLHLHLHLIRRGLKKASRQRGVCVEHLKRCKTSTLIDGIAFSYQVLCHYNEPVLSILPGVYPISFSIAGGVTVDFLVTPTKLWKSTGWKFGRKLLYLQCRSWAHSSRSWGTRHTVFSVVV
jgi:hypothetical protein